MKLKIILLMFTIGIVTSCENDELTMNVNNILGKWTVEEKSSLGESVYEIEIKKDGNGIIIENFYDLTVGQDKKAAKATYTSDFLINIAEQTIDGRKIKGQGTVSESYDFINWSYTVIETEGAEPMDIKATFTKRAVALTNIR